MAIAIKCPACGRGYKLKDELAGKRVKCQCGQPIIVPRPAEEAKPPASADIRDPRIARLKAFIAKLGQDGLSDGYAAAHARLAVEAASAAAERAKLKAAGTLPELPPEARAPADEMYESTVSKLVDGLAQAMTLDLKSGDPKRRGAAEIYSATAP